MCYQYFVAGAMTATQAAAEKRQFEADWATYEQNRANANASAVNEHNAQNQQQQQAEDAANEKLRQNQLETNREAAAARASAGESGIAGTAVDSMLNDIHRQNSVRTLAINRNLDNTTAQLNSERRATEIKRHSRVNSVANPKWVWSYHVQRNLVRYGQNLGSVGGGMGGGSGGGASSGSGG